MTMASWFFWVALLFAAVCVVTAWFPLGGLTLVLFILTGFFALMSCVSGRGELS